MSLFCEKIEGEGAKNAFFIIISENHGSYKKIQEIKKKEHKIL